MSADDPRAAALKFKEMATEKFKAGEFQIARYTYGSAMEVAEKKRSHRYLGGLQE